MVRKNICLGLILTTAIASTTFSMVIERELRQLNRKRQTEEIERKIALQNRKTTNFSSKRNPSRNCLALLDWFISHYTYANIQPNVHPVMNEW